MVAAGAPRRAEESRLKKSSPTPGRRAVAGARRSRADERPVAEGDDRARDRRTVLGAGAREVAGSTLAKGTPARPRRCSSRACGSARRASPSPRRSSNRSADAWMRCRRKRASWLQSLAVLGDDVPESLVGSWPASKNARAAAASEVDRCRTRAPSGCRAVSPDSRRVVEAVRRRRQPERWRQLHAWPRSTMPPKSANFGATSWRLAKLWRGAGEIERALAASLDAASAAESLAKNWVEAAERYRFALTLLPRRDVRRGEIWMKCAEALRRATQHSRCRQGLRLRRAARLERRRPVHGAGPTGAGAVQLGAVRRCRAGGESDHRS